MTDDRFTQHPDGNGPQPLSSSDRHTVANALVEEMSELFHGYLDGDIAFDELTFEMYDTIQTLYAIAQGDVSIEYLANDGLHENIADITDITDLRNRQSNRPENQN
jgi:hypothetical protein